MIIVHVGVPVTSWCSSPRVGESWNRFFFISERYRITGHFFSRVSFDFPIEEDLPRRDHPLRVSSTAYPTFEFQDFIERKEPPGNVNDSNSNRLFLNERPSGVIQADDLLRQ